MIWVNFKTYRQATGKNSIILGKICQAVSRQTKIPIFPVAQAIDIHLLTQSVSLPIWSQHIDNIEYGSHTGHILPEAILAAGARGTILNHSENKIPIKNIQETVKKAQKIGLNVLVCCGSIEEGQEISLFKPDYLAYEPPELIGNRKISVASAKPEIISDFTKKFPKLPIIVGAGIHCQKDVKMSLRLGAKGILVATDVVLANDPQKELLELANGFK